MTERKTRIDKGVRKKGVHPIEVKTEIKVKKQDRAFRETLKKASDLF